MRIACVGDSITEGTANAEYEINSWPRILGRLLEREFPGRYQVGNFGRSGATLLRRGDKPYWDQDVFGLGREFLPSIVVINLGTDDVANRNGLEHGEELEADCRALIEAYRRLESKPRILLGNLTPMAAPYPLVEECAPHRAQIEEILHDLAAEYALEEIDFEAATAGRSELFPDGVHPNTAGNELMAQAAFTALVGRVAPEDSSIRPGPVEGTWRDWVANGQGVEVRPGAWVQTSDWMEGSGAKKLLLSKSALDGGDFHMKVRLRMLGQRNSAAGFVIGENFFGFEGASGTVFRNGLQMGGLRLLHSAGLLWEDEAWIDFEVIRNDGMVWFLVDGFIVDMVSIPGPLERLGFDPMRSRMQVAAWAVVGETKEIRPAALVARTANVPWVDLSRRSELQTVSTGDGAEWEETRGLPSTTDRQVLRFEPGGGAGRDGFARTSADGGVSWSPAFQLPAILVGAGHAWGHLPDGHLLVAFRDEHPSSPTRGDFVAWVGSYDDLVGQREGQFTCRLFDNEGTPESSGRARVEVRPNGEIVATMPCRTIARGSLVVSVCFTQEQLAELLPTRGYGIPLIDLDQDVGRHVVVDREAGQYLGHVTTELLEDGKTLLAVYPKGHGRGEIVYKRSNDGGLTWSERLPTPASWATSAEVPTIHRVVDPETGAKRLILWSGLYPARLARSEDDGATWSELEPVGDWGGIVVMGFVERLRDGAYLAMFHDDGRFFSSEVRRAEPVVFTLYQTVSRDGGLSWSRPEAIWSGADLQLCEPGCVRSPDGSALAVLLRENSRTRNSYLMFSEDEGETWSAPRELPASLTGDRHTLAYGPDGRLFACFRDTAHESPTQGDWVGWVGTWEDLALGRAGQYRVRFKDNKHRWDTAYPGVEVLSDGTFVGTTYGHWDEGEDPYILSVRFSLEELDAKASLVKKASLQK